MRVEGVEHSTDRRPNAQPFAELYKKVAEENFEQILKAEEIKLSEEIKKMAR